MIVMKVMILISILVPIVVTLVGIVIAVSDVHPAKAFSPIK